MLQLPRAALATRQGWSQYTSKPNINRRPSLELLLLEAGSQSELASVATGSGKQLKLQGCHRQTKWQQAQGQRETEWEGVRLCSYSHPGCPLELSFAAFARLSLTFPGISTLFSTVCRCFRFGFGCWPPRRQFLPLQHARRTCHKFCKLFFIFFRFLPAFTFTLYMHT